MLGGHFESRQGHNGHGHLFSWLFTSLAPHLKLNYIMISNQLQNTWKWWFVCHQKQALMEMEWVFNLVISGLLNADGSFIFSTHTFWSLFLIDWAVQDNFGAKSLITYCRDNGLTLAAESHLNISQSWDYLWCLSVLVLQQSSELYCLHTLTVHWKVCKQK